jgi:hypothetical protein
VAASTRVKDEAPSVAMLQHRVIVAVTAIGIVLRWWALGGPFATFDESFTGTYSHLPVGSIPSALRAKDSHPPLDYLLRHFLGGTGDTLALRLPSPVFASVTLLLVAWWMWRRGWFGVAVVTLTSISAFQLLYAHQARMYSLAILCGTALAVCAERWLEEPAARWRWLMALAMVVGLFDHSAFLLAAGGALLVPGLRRDAEAWRWRATIVVCIAVWAGVWGPSFLTQSRGDHATWIPYTSPSTVASAVNGLADLYTVLQWVVVGLLALGGWLLWRQDRTLGRIWLALFVAPLGVAGVIGLHSHFLLTRTLAFAAWAGPLALAAVVERARRISGPAVLVTVAAIFIVVVPSIRPAISYEEDSATAMRAAQRLVQPGDAVAVYPAWLSPLAIWNLGAPRRPVVPSGLDGRGAFVFVRGQRPFDGRVWLLEPNAYAMSTEGLEPCSERVSVPGDYVLRCYTLPPSGRSG